MSNYLLYGSIALVILIILFFVFKPKKKPLKSNEIILALGGGENIINVKQELSRVKVELKDLSLANHNDLMKYGVKGIFEVNNELQLILKDDSDYIYKQIKNLS